MTRDLRKYAEQTNIRLLVGGVLLLFIVGDGLIYLIYGREAAIMGLLCLSAGISPILIIWLALTALDLITKRANPD